MSYYSTTVDYDISSSYLGDKITEAKDEPTSSPPSSDEGMGENERGHTNISDFIDQQKQR